MASCLGMRRGGEEFGESGAGWGRGPAHTHGLAGSGLCGNFNGDTTDDFTTSMGIAEGTASLFVDSWRAGNCPAALERETDPCSMSQLNSKRFAWWRAVGVGRRPMPGERETHTRAVPPEVCAETHCSVLVKTDTVFEKCHTTVDPKPFYKVGGTCRLTGRLQKAAGVAGGWGGVGGCRGGRRLLG